MTWNEAVDLALEPTDLDRAFATTGPFGTGGEIIGENGKVADANRVRERAAKVYLTAHEGEQAEISYCDPNHVDDRSRLVYHSSGRLTRQYVTYPVFHAETGLARNEWGFVVSDKIIPLRGISSIRVEGDNSVVVL